MEMAYGNIREAIIRKQQLEEELGIIAMLETHLGEDDRFRMSGYGAYRYDRDRREGGTALIIKKEMKHH